MFLIKFARKLGKILRGGAGNREIWLGAFCGVLVGMIPGFNLSVVLAAALMLLLNANVGIAVLGMVAGKVVCVLAAPLTFQIGYVIIHGMGLEGMFRAMCETPGLALLDLHYYCLTGGLPVAVVLGAVFAVAMVKAISGLRAAAIRAASGEKMQKVLQNKFVRFVMWLAFGKQKADMEETLTKKSPLFRKAGIALVIALVVIVAALEFALADMLARIGLEKGIAAATGAEVNVAKARLSLLDGKLDVQGLQVTDPSKPEQNLIQIGRFEADVSVRDLLRKAYVVDLLKGDDVRLNAPRKTPGKVFRKPKKEEEKEEAAKGKGKSLEHYFAKAKEWKKHLRKVQEYLKKRKTEAAQRKKPAPEAQKQSAVAQAKESGYLNANAKALLAKHPVWLIHKVKLDHVAAPGLEPQRIEGEELCGQPELNRKPMKLLVRPQTGGEPSVKLVFHFEQSEPRHEAALNVKDVKLGESLGLSSDLPLDVRDGRADVSAKGTFTESEVDIPFKIVVRNLKAKTQPGKSVLGLDPATAQEVFKSLERLDIVGALQGSLTSPRVTIDQQKLLASLKQALVKAGKQALLKQADAQLEKYGKKAAEELKTKLGGKTPEAVQELKKKLPGGLGEKKKPADVLKKFF